MAYIPTEWETGDIITAEKLNKLENGVAAIAGVMVVNGEEEGDTLTLASTYNEIAAALSAGIPVFISAPPAEAEGYMFLVFSNAVIGGDTTTYQVSAFDFSNSAEIDFVADSADGYPAFTFQ